VGLFNEFRRYVIHGRGASDVLESWQKKIEYRYWEARLKEGFRFESVRKLASKRFSAARYFMMQLGTEHSAKDLEDTILESLNSKPDS